MQAAALQEAGCEQYELFQSVDAPDRMVILECWASQALLEQHMGGERTRHADAIVALWAPGTTPTIDRFET